MLSTPPASRRISQDTLRRWKKTGREATVIYNQVASFNRCLVKVQQDMGSDRWQNLQDKISKILSLPACPVRLFMSLIGLLTATEKQVYLGRLHMRPMQCHLKNNWRVPESLEKVIPVPRSLHPNLQWWLKEDDVLTGQPL